MGFLSILKMEAEGIADSREIRFIHPHMQWNKMFASFLQLSAPEQMPLIAGWKILRKIK
ncbi:MAG TPA: hypothetical protein VIT88_01335 [Pyrinomonadaceae bacterium]